MFKYRSLLGIYFYFGLLLFLHTTSFLQGAYATEYLVIAHKENPVKNLEFNEAVSIFLGVQHVYSNGYEIEIIDQQVENDIYAGFYRALTDKSVAQIRSRRASLTFAGISLPPEIVENDVEVMRWIQKHKWGIGYIYADSWNDSVKVLLRVPGKPVKD